MKPAENNFDPNSIFDIMEQNFTAPNLGTYKINDTIMFLKAGDKIELIDGVIHINGEVGRIEEKAKKIITKDLDDLELYLEGDYPYTYYTIDEIIATLEKWKSKGATHIWAKTSEYSTDTSLYAAVQREETTEEYSARIHKELEASLSQTQKQQNAEKALYLELKKKFEGE